MLHRLAALSALLTVLAVPAAAGAKPKPQKQFYLSMGDSYAVGYQPVPGGSTNQGFANQLLPLAAKRGYDLALRNFGCGGATTASLLEQKGCPKRARAKAGRVTYKGTQIKAVETFLKANRKRTGLITISISGNDVTKCAAADDAVKCVSDATTSINENLSALLKRLRKAAGPKVRIVGTTYPDVILGEYVTGADGQSLAGLSQIAFKSLINPALKKQYEAVGGDFVDVTKATGGYGDLKTAKQVAVPGFEVLKAPKPVATICKLTWFCAKRDIHARANGYGVIAKLIARTLPKRG